MPDLGAEFISPKKCAFGLTMGKIIPKSVKCIHSATKLMRETERDWKVRST